MIKLSSQKTTSNFEWFNSQVGSWKSYRRYFYPGKNTTLVCESDLVISKLEEEIIISWKTKGDVESEGEMAVRLSEDGSQLIRSRGYFTDNETYSEVERLSETLLQTYTEYNGKKYLEKIENFPGFRTRQTLGWRISDNKLILIGQYYEERLL